MRAICVKDVLLPRTGGAVTIDPEEAKAISESKDIQDLRKRAGVPEIDPDALPTSYIRKLKSCVEKRMKTLSALRDAFDETKRLTPTQTKRLVCNLF